MRRTLACGIDRRNGGTARSAQPDCRSAAESLRHDVFGNLAAQLWPFARRRPSASTNPSKRSRPLIWAAACAGSASGGVVVSQKRTNSGQRFDGNAEIALQPLHLSRRAGRAGGSTPLPAARRRPATGRRRPPLRRSADRESSCGRQARRSASASRVGKIDVHAGRA